MRFVLEGTSSCGKSSIIKEFPKKYKRVAIDDLYEANYNCDSSIKNKYYSNKQRDEMRKVCFLKELGRRAGKSKDFVIDTVNEDPPSPEQLNKYLPKDTINVLIYTNLERLAKNIYSRRLYDPRGKWLFKEQFTKYYVKTTNLQDSIDTINLDSFIKSLEHIKYEFESKKDLVKFAKNIFKSMNITGKEAHIKPRYSKFDMVIDTTGKTPKQLKQIIFNQISNK